MDTVILKYSAQINGLTSITLGHLDVLSGLEKVKICVAYEVNGEVTTDLPCDLPNLTNLKPIYEELPGWKEDLETATSLDDIPANCLAYVKRVEELAGAPVAAISVGPAREQTIIIPGVSSGLN